MRGSDLVGRWVLESWVQDYDDGRVKHPMGNDATGFVRYAEDGDFAVMISRSGRSPFTTGGQWDASEAEKATAYESMLAYGGRYEFVDDHVLHHVEISLFPDWIGGVQRRRLVAAGDGTIALEARLDAGTAQARTARIVWRRK
ncbi:lipocalin-like domain-containing protein [Streptomyces sp. NPDC051985]|uniref:lipocalin-like domain-containing protein n=1 Tax=Streptomyces sp. NPDC051985 TaxID=3155807 RepID=UPI003425CF92